MRVEYILCTTAVLTLLLNLLLAHYLLKDKLKSDSTEIKRNDIVHFNLMPPAKLEAETDTEILATEIIADGDH